MGLPNQLKMLSLLFNVELVPMKGHKNRKCHSQDRRTETDDVHLKEIIHATHIHLLLCNSLPKFLISSVNFLVKFWFIF